MKSIVTADIVKNGEINISKDLWKDLNESFDKDFIKQLISDAIEQNNLELPYRKIIKKEVKEDFEALRNLDTTSLFVYEPFHTRYDYKWNLSETYITSCNVGNKSSDYFHQKSRFLCDSINAPSPFRTWTTEKFRLTLLNALWTLKFPEINNKTLRSAISLRKYIASQFKPCVAKAIYDRYQAKNVLDFSSGWGDRLSGFCAYNNGVSYTGVDPNKNLVKGYARQIKEYGKDKDIKMICAQAEDIDYDREFDLIFTSPPYFDVERYSSDCTQSWKRYKKIDQWLNSFLFIAIRKAWDKLESGGHMIINISDVYCHHTINKICDPMNNYISSLPDSEYDGCIGMRMAKRPNSKAHKDGVFGEPMWIWRKQ